MKNECEGCAVYVRDHCIVGVIPRMSDKIQCPCRTCLVKMICSINVICKEFTDYRILSNEKRDMDIVHMNQWRNK